MWNARSDHLLLSTFSVVCTQEGIPLAQLHVISCSIPLKYTDRRSHLHHRPNILMHSFVSASPFLPKYLTHSQQCIEAIEINNRWYQVPRVIGCQMTLSSTISLTLIRRSNSNLTRTIVLPIFLVFIYFVHFVIIGIYLVFNRYISVQDLYCILIGFVLNDGTISTIESLLS